MNYKEEYFRLECKYQKLLDSVIGWGDRMVYMLEQDLGINNDTTKQTVKFKVLKGGIL